MKKHHVIVSLHTFRQHLTTLLRLMREEEEFHGVVIQRRGENIAMLLPYPKK